MEKILRLWKPLLEKWISSAILHSVGALTPTACLSSILSGQEFPWLAYVDGEIKGFGLTQLLRWQEGTLTARVTCLAGKQFTVWKDTAIEEFEKWAGAYDAEGLEILGRPGFKPFLESVGYETVQYLYVKRVQNGRQ